MSQLVLHATARMQLQDIREVYLGIHASLESLEDKLHAHDILIAPAKELEPDTYEQERAASRQLILQQLQYDIIAKLQSVAGHSEAFWINYSWRPDTYFWNRKLPAIDSVKSLDKPQPVKVEDIGKEETQLKRVTVTDKPALPRSERIRANRHKYDLRDAVVINPSATVRTALVSQVVTAHKSEMKFYTGEIDDRYRPADIPAYHHSLSTDVAVAIFQILRRYRLFAAMLAVYSALATSQLHCHLAFNGQIIDAMFDDLESDTDEPRQTPFREPKYLSAVHHAQYYALTLLHHEENITNGWADESHRHVLDPHVMEKIPRLNYKTTANPWVPMNLNPEQMINPANPLKMEDVDAKYRGFHPMPVFKVRYEVFHEGTLNDLAMDNIHVVGSVIPACLVRNPLELQFGIECDRTDVEYWKDPETQRRLRLYYDEYYPSKNVLSGWDNVTDEDLVELEDELSDIDLVITAENDLDYHRIVTRIYETIQRNLRKTKPNLEAKDLQILKMKTWSSYKYYISGRALSRSYELFRFQPGVTTLAGVSRFHFPSVRATYDGYTFKVMPSCFVYATTGILTGHRWFSVNENCMNGILKYYTRGGYLPMNLTEIDSLKQHLAGQGKSHWGDIMHYSKMGLNHPIFRPRERAIGLFGKYHPKDQTPKDQSGVLPPYMSLLQHHEYKLYDVVVKHDEWPAHLEFRYPHGNIIPWSLQRALKDIRDLVFSKKHQSVEPTTPIDAKPATHDDENDSE